MISIKRSLILLSIFSIFMIVPNPSDAEVYPEQYDFGYVEVGSMQTTSVLIKNISGPEIPLSVSLLGDTCGVFSVVTSPVPMTVAENTTVEIQIGYSPSSSEQCSAEFHIYTDVSPGALASDIVTLTGTGDEPQAQNDELVNGEQLVDVDCPCDDNWKNHGQYVSCVARAAKEALLGELITQEERGAIVSAAAKNDCGRKK
jgi:hypothetical protein